MSVRVISFDYILKNSSGAVVDSSEGKSPLTFMEGGNEILPALEKAVSAMKTGERQTVKLTSSEAFGELRKDWVIRVPLDKLPGQNVKVGDRFRGGPEADAPIFVVKEKTETEATLDANHPLAGEDLAFDVHVVDMRDATEEEQKKGHARCNDCDCGHDH